MEHNINYEEIIENNCKITRKTDKVLFLVKKETLTLTLESKRGKGDQA